MSTNNENHPQSHNTRAPTQAPSAANPSNTSSTLPKNERTDLKEHSNLLPKTIEEIKEIQARGRSLLTQRNEIKPSRPGLQQQQPKSEEELKIEQLQREKDIKELAPQIIYSLYYQDDEYEYRNVVLPKNLARWLPQNRLLKKEDLVQVGVHQSSGWEHYMIYKPEPHILPFKRKRNYLLKYGAYDPHYPPEDAENIEM